MNRTLLSWGRSLFAGALLGIASAHGGTVSYAPGDLFLGVRAVSGAGAPQDYLVNIGPASAYRDATAPLTLSGLGNLAADLAAIFGPDWSSRSDVRWNIAGTPGHSTANGDPGRTVYVTSGEPEPYQRSSVLLRATSAAQAGPTNKLGSLAVAYLQVQGVPNESTQNSPVAIVQSTTDTNSYASFHNAVSSYSYFSPPIEADFSNSAAGSIADLYRLVPAAGADVGAPGEFLGTFHFDDNGVLNFIPQSIATVRLERAVISVGESDGHATLKVIRAGNTSNALEVSIATVDGSAHVGSDYSAPTTTVVSFAPGETEQGFAVSIANRAGYQGDRQFDVALSSPSAGGLIITPATARITIVEAEPAPAGEIAFSAASYQVPALNGLGAPNTIDVTLARTGGSAGAVSVALSVTGGSLINGTDYAAINGPITVNFAEGQAARTFSIHLNQIAATALPGTIELALSSPTGGATLGTVTTSTISVFESGGVAFGSATYTVVEPAAGTVEVGVSVVRTGQNGAASVQVVRTGGSATSGQDFTAAFPITLAWDDGESGEKSFVISVNADSELEGLGETIVLALQNPTGGIHLASPTNSTVNIRDRDSSVPVLTVSSPKAKSTTTAPSVTFRGTARDDQGISRVEVRLGGNLVQTAVPSGPTTKFDWEAVVTPEQGANSAEVIAFDLSGNASKAVTLAFSFNHLRPHLAGSYNGLIVPDPVRGTPAIHHGIVSVSVTSTGRFSGKVTLAGTTLPIRGIFRTDGTARFGTLLSPTYDLVRKGTQPLALGALTLAIDASTGLQITGALSNASAGTLAAIPHADRAVYTSKANPVAPYRTLPGSLYDPETDKGRYTALFQAAPAPNNGHNSSEYPLGDGYGTVSLGKNGVVKIVGKLADGSTVSYANSLSKDNGWPVFVQLYGKKGFIFGSVVFDPTQAGNDATGVGLKWFKPSGLAAQAYYPDGWADGIETDFVTSKYVVPNGTTTPLGLSAPASVEITATNGDLPADITADATLASNGKIVTVGSGPSVPNGISGKLAVASGALSGTFKHPVSGKLVKFNGVALQKAKLAGGYFLHVPAKGQPGISGSIRIAEK